MPTVFAEHKGLPHLLALDGAWLLKVKFGFDPNWNPTKSPLPGQLQLEVDAMIDTGATGFVVPQELLDELTLDLQAKRTTQRSLPKQVVNAPKPPSGSGESDEQQAAEPVWEFHCHVPGLGWACAAPGVIRPVRTQLDKNNRPAIMLGRECLQHLRLVWDHTVGEVSFTA